MKSTVHFKNTIMAYLENRANNDTLFAAAYAKDNKNIDDCINYILNEVQKSGCNGFTDDEIYSMAVHYYDEDSIGAQKPIDCSRIVVNHVVELTADEKEQARKDAIQKACNEEYKRIKQPLRKPVAKQTTDNQQLNLFNF